MATHYEGPPAQQRAFDAYVKLHRCTESLRTRTAAFVAEHDLSYSQFATLEVLYHRGPLCQRDIATKVLRSGGNLTLVIDNLEKAGLVQRRAAPHDRRQKVVTLTPRGRDKIAAMFPAHAERVTALLSVLSAKEQQQLAALCRKLGRSLAVDT